MKTELKWVKSTRWNELPRWEADDGDRFFIIHFIHYNGRGLFDVFEMPSPLLAPLLEDIELGRFPSLEAAQEAVAKTL